MTTNDVEILLKYALSLYPNVRWSESEFNDKVNVWANEFKNNSKEEVGKAFRLSMSNSPCWLPSVQMVKEEIKSVWRFKPKSREQEFKDSHCGKSADEWNKVDDWKKSDDYNKFISELKNRVCNLIKG